jgi:hypothetical protein
MVGSTTAQQPALASATTAARPRPALARGSTERDVTAADLSRTDRVAPDLTERLGAKDLAVPYRGHAGKAPIVQTPFGPGVVPRAFTGSGKMSPAPFSQSETVKQLGRPSKAGGDVGRLGAGDEAFGREIAAARQRFLEGWREAGSTSRPGDLVRRPIKGSKSKVSALLDTTAGKVLTSPFTLGAVGMLGGPAGVASGVAGGVGARGLTRLLKSPQVANDLADALRRAVAASPELSRKWRPRDLYGAGFAAEHFLMEHQKKLERDPEYRAAFGQ